MTVGENFIWKLFQSSTTCCLTFNEGAISQKNWCIQKKEDSHTQTYAWHSKFWKSKRWIQLRYYDLATLCHFTESVGRLSPLLNFKYKPENAEIYRSAAVSGYNKRVNKIYQRRTILAQEIQSVDGLPSKLKLSKLDVMVDIGQNRMHFYGSRSSKNQRRKAQNSGRAELTAEQEWDWKHLKSTSKISKPLYP